MLISTLIHVIRSFGCVGRSDGTIKFAYDILHRRIISGDNSVRLRNDFHVIHVHHVIKEPFGRF